jgi:hypothetical protein
VSGSLARVVGAYASVVGCRGWPGRVIVEPAHPDVPSVKLDTDESGRGKQMAHMSHVVPMFEPRSQMC